MTNDADTLATELYATTCDMLKEHPDLAPWRLPAYNTPRLSDALGDRLTKGRSHLRFHFRWS